MAIARRLARRAPVQTAISTTAVKLTNIARQRITEILSNMSALTRQWFPLLVCLCLAACGSPEKAWELAERDDTKQGYLEFLAKNPDGELADRARDRMKRLKLERAWERAEFRDRIDNYERFLNEYPDSEFSVNAGLRIYELRRDQAWETVVDEESAAKLESFLEVYPDAPQADEARERIAILAALEPPPAAMPPPERAGDFRLQLGAFRTAAASAMEVRRLDAAFGELLPGPIRIMAPVETGGTRFILRSVPLSMREARELCDGLKDRGQDCFVVNK
jgi:phosphoserine phosphatase